MSVTTEDAAETKFTNSLSGYLNDHLAGETLGLELARRASSEHEGERLGTSCCCSAGSSKKTASRSWV